MGRPKKTPPKNATEKITRLAERGVRESDIAAALGVNPKVFRRWKNEREEIQEALTAARQVEEDKLVGMLFEKAMDGDRTSAMFLLKTRHGYKEGLAAINAKTANVQINLPAASDEKSYLKQLENE